MLDRLQQLPIGAAIPLVFLAAAIGIGIALLVVRRQR